MSRDYNSTSLAENENLKMEYSQIRLGFEIAKIEITKISASLPKHLIKRKQAIHQKFLTRKIMASDIIHFISEEAAEYLDYCTELEDGQCGDLDRYNELKINSDDHEDAIQNAIIQQEAMIISEQLTKLYFYYEYHGKTDVDFSFDNFVYLKGAIDALEINTNCFQIDEAYEARNTYRKLTNINNKINFTNEIDLIKAEHDVRNNSTSMSILEACNSYARTKKENVTVRRMQDRYTEGKKLKTRYQNIKLDLRTAHLRFLSANALFKS